MRSVTKYAMLVSFMTSFIALNNCGNQSSSSNQEKVSEEQNGPAADFAIIGGPPIGYPGFYGPFGYPGLPLALPFFPIEVNCDDGTDDDGDGLTDCQDNDCHVHPECSEWGPPLEELINERSLTVYPNGIIIPEDIALLKARGADDDDAHGWQRDNFFAAHQKDCWIDPRYQDPYFFIPLGEALVAGPDGPIGPSLYPPEAVVYFGPRAGLINECEFGTDLMFHHMDDDNGAGAGAAGDTEDDEGGISEDGFND
jgi:hypothetical protein